jgi:hypothetical protein
VYRRKVEGALDFWLMTVALSHFPDHAAQAVFDYLSNWSAINLDSFAWLVLSTVILDESISLRVQSSRMSHQLQQTKVSSSWMQMALRTSTWRGNRCHRTRPKSLRSPRIQVKLLTFLSPKSALINCHLFLPFPCHFLLLISHTTLATCSRVWTPLRLSDSHL